MGELLGISVAGVDLEWLLRLSVKVVSREYWSGAVATLTIGLRRLGMPDRCVFRIG
jgi:hypothetical protein